MCVYTLVLETMGERLRGSIELTENRYTCRVINIGCTPAPSESTISPFSLLPSPFCFVSTLESRPEVYNLAREVRGHGATRQSAYAYAAIFRQAKPFSRKRRNGGSLSITRAVVNLSRLS